MDRPTSRSRGGPPLSSSYERVPRYRPNTTPSVNSSLRRTVNRSNASLTVLSPVASTVHTPVKVHPVAVDDEIEDTVLLSDDPCYSSFEATPTKHSSHQGGSTPRRPVPSSTSPSARFHPTEASGSTGGARPTPVASVDVAEEDGQASPKGDAREPTAVFTEGSRADEPPRGGTPDVSARGGRRPGSKRTKKRTTKSSSSAGSPTQVESGDHPAEKEEGAASPPRKPKRVRPSTREGRRPASGARSSAAPAHSAAAGSTTAAPSPLFVAKGEETAPQLLRLEVVDNGGHFSVVTGGGGDAVTDSGKEPDAHLTSIPDLPRRPSSCHAAGNRPRHVNLGKRELLGKGTFGIVYRAMDLDTNRIIAVKEITIAPGSMRPEELEKLRREIGLMQRLDHPNIVKCLGEHWDGQQHLRIFMEYVAGGTISSVLRSFGRFTEPQAARYAKQILEGLKYLHEKRIVHRDLKGDNLLVDVDGGLKLADFGTAKELATRSKTVAGTAFFMAPEVIRGTGHGIAADVWSVGACVVEMLQAKPPFTGFANQFAIMMHIAELQDGGFPVPSDISASCRDFLDQCFRVDQDLRPSCTDLLQHPWILDPPHPNDPRSAQAVVSPLPTVTSPTLAGNKAKADLPATAGGLHASRGGANGNEAGLDSFNPMQSIMDDEDDDGAS